MELQEGCKNIVVGDCLSLFQNLVKTQLRGVSVEGYYNNWQQIIILEYNLKSH